MQTAGSPTEFYHSTDIGPVLIKIYWYTDFSKNTKPVLKATINPANDVFHINGIDYAGTINAEYHPEYDIPKWNKSSSYVKRLDWKATTDKASSIMHELAKSLPELVIKLYPDVILAANIEMADRNVARIESIIENHKKEIAKEEQALYEARVEATKARQAIGLTVN